MSMADFAYEERFLGRPPALATRKKTASVKPQNKTQKPSNEPVQHYDYLQDTDDSDLKWYQK